MELGELDPSPLEGVHKLPAELLCHIFRLAASTHIPTAHACAFVSKKVCRWTASDRWRTIVCTTLKQLDSLLKLVITGVDLDVSKLGPKPFTSLPSNQPGDFVRDLFIETDVEESSAWDTVAYIDRLDRLAQFNPLLLFPNVGYLALGNYEIGHLLRSPAFPLVRKLLVSYSNEDSLRQFFGELDGTYQPDRSSDDGHRALQSLHIVAIDRGNKLSGLPMPIQMLAGMRSGSISTDGYVSHFVDNISQEQRLVEPEDVLDEKPEDSEKWNTNVKIRFDTRKFAFRPCEITASRLKPFFEELTTVIGEASGADQPPRPVAETFSHTGPRHAAPHRGAGNHLAARLNSRDHITVSTPKREALASLGCGKFQKLHLCWDPLPDSKVTPAHESHGVVETDWPVERQDIWTNTAMHANEARAQQSRVQTSRTGRQPETRKDELTSRPGQKWVIPPGAASKDSASFKADMVDSIRTTLGWTRQEQELLSNTPLFSRDADLSNHFGSHERVDVLKRIVATHLPPGTIDDPNEALAVRIVPPAERLRLGGYYVPFTKKQRVQWFLDNLDTDEA